MNAKEIFLGAIEINDLNERKAFVREQCQEDVALQRKVEALLVANDEPESFLDRPAARFDVTGTLTGMGSGSNLSDSSHHGRFLPGTKLADRYRIVSMLGRGGMGEVYRADDLRLGQTVALKFLPPELAKDSKRLDYFHQEVKLARQISHPNICRVYDMDQVNGQHFLSMEYIDGEDLKTLLHRIGRLPMDKGIQIARQLCSGLSAAHAKGVLHRDLKPANIMIDGQGQVRITDFGLATISADGENVIGMSGTPAYMAPEQLLRGQTSVRSDIYSLGLILYEVFTGKPVHNAGSLAELQQLHENSSSPRSPSDVMDDLDPAVERAISRCIASDAALRPRSVNELAAALPGGDPLAAALAAGETPHPDIVAASGDSKPISVRTAVSLFAAIVAGLIAIVFLNEKGAWINKLDPLLSPEVLTYRSQQVLERLGYQSDATSGDFAFGFDYFTAQSENFRIARTEGYANWPILGFWYRETPEEYHSDTLGHGISRAGTAAVDLWYPGWSQSGEKGVRLDNAGRLRWFQAIPKIEGSLSPTKDNPAWADWFTLELVGFRIQDLTTTDTLVIPPVVYDAVQSWVGMWPGTNQPLNVIAAAYQGHPVYFEILFDPKKRMLEPISFDVTEEIAISTFTTIRWLLAVVSVGLITRNLYYGRWDRRGAWCLVVSFFVFCFLATILRAHHVQGQWELAVINTCAAAAFLHVAWLWISYVSLEPTVRRYWPGLLVSWARVLSGKLNDSKVGIDILVGSLFGIAICICVGLCPLLDHKYKAPIGPDSLLGPSLIVGKWLFAFSQATKLILFGTFFLTIARILVRRESVALAIMLLFFGLTTSLADTTFSLILWPVQFLNVVLLTMLLVRFGLLAAIIALTVNWVLIDPITCDTSAFYFTNTVLSIGFVLVLVGFGFFTSLGGWPRLVKSKHVSWQT